MNSYYLLDLGYNIIRVYATENGISNFKVLAKELKIKVICTLDPGQSVKDNFNQIK